MIIRALIGDGVLTDLDSNLSSLKRAQSLGLRATLEDRVYLYNVREKRVDNYYAMRGGVLGGVPWPMRIVVGAMAFRSVSTMLHGQGTGRYSAEEVSVWTEEAWEGINAVLPEAKSRSVGTASSREPF